MHQVQQSLEEQQLLRRAKPCSDENAIKAMGSETTRRGGLGSRAEVNEAADHLMAQAAHALEPCIDECANELRRQVRRCRQVDMRRVEAESENGGPGGLLHCIGAEYSEAGVARVAKWMCPAPAQSRAEKLVGSASWS